jgi:hypothetical protein
MYVHPERGDRDRVRRVQWTRDNGIATLDFNAPEETR